VGCVKHDSEHRFVAPAIAFCRFIRLSFILFCWNLQRSSFFSSPFSIHPFAYVWRTISKFYSLRLALSQEIHRVHIDLRDLIEIKHDEWRAVCDQRLQLREMLRAQTTTESKEDTVSAERPFDF